MANMCTKPFHLLASTHSAAVQSYMSSLTTVNYSDTFNPKIVSMIFGH